MCSVKPHQARNRNLLTLINERYAGIVGKLADAMGKKRPIIYRLFSASDSRRQIGEELAREIEAFHGLPVGWLDDDHHGDKDSLRRLLGGIGEPAPSPRSRLPLLTWADAGRMGQETPFRGEDGGPVVVFEQEASALAFCLRVVGDTMVRTDGTGFPPGCVIAVEPARKPRHGDYVIARFPEAESAMFAQYVAHGPTVLLKPLNSSYPHVELTNDAKIVGVVFEKRVTERF